ncbi:VOC family protein [Metabacillus sp. KIGAM252]|uniref:VOC family protein n=1 Tax=Metabacillus flavus TaxID=2823519 RepID=A0ABS5LIM8_9BACI|nr:VOC family protein [Metabacillus flavus]MBS2970606.1 VOC family protein [Metabacillus flavus]
MKLDHIVHYVKQPPVQAGAEFQLLGFHTVPGGSHENWGTANSLSYFSLAYLEFLAIEDKDKAEKSDNPLIQMCARQENESLCQMAIRTNEMDVLAEKLKGAGLTVKGPFSGSRTRADGTKISWRMLFAEQPESEFPLPFFIEWGESDEVRKEDLIRTGALAPHPNGIKMIREVIYLSENPEKAASQWSEWLQLEKDEKEGEDVKISLGDTFVSFRKSECHHEKGIYAVSFYEKNNREPREKMWHGGTYIL